MKVIFIKKYMMDGKKQVVGQRATLWGDEKGKELISLGVAEMYSGSMDTKTKFNLSKLK